MDDSASFMYENGSEHLEDELEKLDALLYLQVVRFREAHNGDRQDALDGLFIGEEEVDRIMCKKSGPGKKSGLQPILKQVQILREKISRKSGQSAIHGVPLPFIKLSRAFQLTPFEMDIILVCLAPELDSKYERLYAFLQDDITKKAPSVNLVLELLGTSRQEKLAARACFFEQAPLLKCRLIKFIDNGGSRPLISRILKLDDRIVNFLVEQDDWEANFSAGNLILPTRDWSCLVAENELIQRLKRLQETCFQGGEDNRVIFYLQGPNGVGKKLLAEAFCFQLELSLLVIDVEEIAGGDSLAGIDRKIERLFREAQLRPAAIYLEHFDCLPAGNSREMGGTHINNTLVRAIEDFSIITFFAGEMPWNPPPRLREHLVVKIELPIPSFQLRKKLWEKSLNGCCSLSRCVNLDEIADKFKFTGGQIKDAFAEAKYFAVMRGTFQKEGLTTEDLYCGCHTQSNHNLTRIARKIIPHYTWSDIVLPPDDLQQLKEMCNYVKYRHLVYGEWGFDKKISLGKGLNILFSGPSGTGKTMASEIIANELNLDLYKIDLSCVVSKYIGETEKNLSAIFKEAETANAVLFFDEADALFGKRSEVKDSHDRYANIEINFLLQKMEEHEGIVILATNFRTNLDEAFTRRMHFSLDFTLPDREHRLAIWNSIFPVEIPKSSTIDFDFLAKRFKIAGGSIKNIALHAAFLAADNSKKVEMDHIVYSARREYRKLGRLCTQLEFGKYYDQVMKKAATAGEKNE